jgi:hypothetical protein
MNSTVAVHLARPIAADHPRHRDESDTLQMLHTTFRHDLPH